MSTVAGLLQKLTKDNSWIDDSIDRLTRRYIVGIVALQLLVVYGGGFLRGNYIQCFTPKYFTGAQEKYSEKLCWLESTHYIIEPEDKEAVNDIGKLGFYNVPIYKTTGGLSGYVGIYTEGQRISVSYYQWVPWFLILLALLSYVPFVIWKNMSLVSGLHLKSMVSAARAMSNVDSKGEKTRAGYGDDLTEMLTRYSISRRAEKATPWGIGKKHGNLMFYSYVLIKVIYIINFIVQLLLLQLFLGNDPRFDILMHGAWVLRNLFTTGTWPRHPVFPVDTTCVIVAEQQGNPLPYTLQCILPMNLYFEKFFALFTIAFPILIFLFFLSLVGWIRANSKSGRDRFLQSHLIKPLALDDSDALGSDSADIEAFHRDFLQRDGIFALELIKMNVGGFVCDTVLEKLWNRFLQLRRDNPMVLQRQDALDRSSSPSVSGGSSLKKRTPSTEDTI